MDNIRQERLSEGQVLNLNKNLNKIHETRNLAHASRNMWSLRSGKSKQCKIPRSKVISEKLATSQKLKIS